MIVTTDIANILYRDCQPIGIDVVLIGKKLTGPMKSERVVIHANETAAGSVLEEILR